MEAWKLELKRAVEAGEREFGPLDAHQTVKHNLVRRCEEILGEQSEAGPAEQVANMLPGADGA